MRRYTKPKYQYAELLVRAIASHMLVNCEYETLEGYLNTLQVSPAEMALIEELFPDGDDTDWEAELEW